MGRSAAQRDVGSVTQPGGQERSHTPQSKQRSHRIATVLRGHPDAGTRAAPQSPPGVALRAQGASLKATQVVVQRLDVGEDAHGVRLAAHHHHVLHLDEALAVGQVPETQSAISTTGPAARQPPQHSCHHCPGQNQPGAGGPQEPQEGMQITPEGPQESHSLTQCFPNSHIQEPPIPLIF